MKFFQGNLKCDALLSTGPEFVHDHLLHILPTIEQLYNHPGQRGKLIKQFALGYRTLILAQKRFEERGPHQREQLDKFHEKIEMAQVGLSIYVDTTTSVPEEELSKGEFALRNFMVSLWNGKNNWSGYLEKRFTIKKMQNLKIERFWHQLVRLEIAHDVERNQNTAPKPLDQMQCQFFHRTGLAIEAKTPLGLKEIYTIVDQGKIIVDRGKIIADWGKRIYHMEYLIRGIDASFVLTPENPVKIGEIVNLQSHPHLIDIACQYALTHGSRTVILDDIPSDWPTYFALGFRYEYPFEQLNYAMLIDYARSLNLLSRVDELLLSKIGSPHIKYSISDDDPVLGLPVDLFQEWVREANSGALKTGSLIPSLGQNKLLADLADLRRRMQRINDNDFGLEETENTPRSGCNLL